MVHRKKYFGTHVNYKVDYDYDRVGLVVVLGLLIICGALLSSLYFNFDLVENLVMTCILVVVFGILASYIMGNSVVREIEKEFVREVERPIPIIKEYVRTIDNPIIKVVEKPYPIIRKIEKKIYIKRKKSKKHKKR